MKDWRNLFSSKRREYLLVIILFALAAIVFTWPLILHVHDGILGGYGDHLLNTWIISWDAKTIFSHPTRLFQGNIMYPSRDVLAYSEHLFTLGILAAPIYFVSGNPILAYNILLFLGLVFSAFGCYLLIKELTGSRWGGLVGGLFFAFCPYKLSQLIHIHIIFSPFLPLMLLSLYRYLDRGGRKNLILFGLFFLAQSLASWHYLVYCSMAASLLWVWTAIFSRKKEEWSRLAGVVIAVLVVILLIVPFALPYLRANQRLPGFGRSLEESGFSSASAKDYLRVLPESLLYRHAPSPFQIGGAGILKTEKTLYPGLVIILLALAGLFIRRRKEDETYVFDPGSFRMGALFFLVLTVLSLLLTFGPLIGGVNNLLYTVPYHLGILKFIRVPARFYVLAALGLSVLAGYGTGKIAVRVAGWRKSVNAGRLAVAVIMILLLAEMAIFNMSVYPVPARDEVPEVYSWLSEQADAKVIELPPSPLAVQGNYRYDDQRMGFFLEDDLEFDLREGMSMYLSTYHWKKIANGYSGYFPILYTRIYTEMQAFPSERSVDLLRGLEIDYVIWQWDLVDEEQRAEYRERLAGTPGLTLEKDFGNEVVYRVEPGETASTGDLEVSLASPRAVPGGEGLNLGILAKNGGANPFVVTDEDPQPFLLSFLDGAGNTVYEERGDYRALFFLDGGEEISVPLKATGTPAEGSYLLRLELTGGVLGGRMMEQAVEVRSTQELVGTAFLDGNVAMSEETNHIEIPVANGLYPLVLEVENSGDILWRSSWEESQLTEEYPFGLVYLGVKWGQGSEVVWEEQAGFLPGDVSPGQTMEVPILVRPPQEPGTYQLFVALRDRTAGWFGSYLLMEATVR